MAKAMTEYILGGAAMRITRPSYSEDPNYISKKLALDECKICPSCKSTAVYPRKDNYGNLFPDEYTDYRLFWNMKFKRMVYTCPDCGCEYESDPYDYSAEPKTYQSIISMTCAIGLFAIAAAMMIGNRSLWGIVVHIILGLAFTVFTILSKVIYKRHEFHSYDPVEVHIDTRKLSTDCQESD